MSIHKICVIQNDKPVFQEIGTELNNIKSTKDNLKSIAFVSSDLTVDCSSHDVKIDDFINLQGNLQDEINEIKQFIQLQSLKNDNKLTANTNHIYIEDREPTNTRIVNISQTGDANTASCYSIDQTVCTISEDVFGRYIITGRKPGATNIIIIYLSTEDYKNGIITIPVSVKEKQ